MGLIAPHQCLACGVDGSPLCGVCRGLLPPVVPCCYRCRSVASGAETCRRCRSSSPLSAVYVCADYEGVAEQLVRQLKFERVMAVAPILAAQMAELLPAVERWVVVPVPTATGRVRRRGYDQSILIARSLSNQRGLPYATTLERNGQQRQTGSGRSERLKQLDGAFAVRPRAPLPSSVLLVDDVTTTGATLETAATILRQAGVKHVAAIVFARAM